jgi:hypothetical protein
MQKLLLCGTLVAAAMLFPQATRAAEGPWCAVLNFGSMGPSENCSMRSFEACRELAMHYGSSSFCRQNAAWPGYRPSGPQAKSHARKKKRRHHE